MTRPMLAFTLALAAVAAADAAPIYRCGNTYSQVACPEGGSIVDATDPRTGAQRAEARRIAEAERKAAAQLERERKGKEKEQSGQATPGALIAAPAASAASSPRGKPHAKKGAKHAAAEKDFVAAVPGDKSARK